MLSTAVALSADAPAPDGRALYQSLCVRCHGADGEGVEGRHDEALRGEMSVERLARRIHRTMPEDDPGRCQDREADAVARYIYGAFYSPQAQARSRPVRVELVHLTNRQYQNAIADLIGFFRGDAERSGDERGLRAVYYNDRGFRRDRQVEARLDAQVEFGSEGAGLHPKQDGTNGFSVQWQGSVVAEETGDYVFLLKTPNGARLWVNSDDPPLIDAWVASGSVEDHRAVLRLLGGRRYLLRLDWSQFKEKRASVALHWIPPHGARETVPTRVLVPTRARPVLVVGTPFPPDDSSVGYGRGVSVSKAWDEATTFAAIEVANEVFDDVDRLSGSQPTDPDRIDRLQAFCAEFVARAFRRPLTEDEEQVYVGALFQQAGSPEEAVKRVVLRALKSPRFLYLGLDDSGPDDFTIASRLSFTLWDSLPDRALWDQAAQGRLRSHEAVARQARRMLTEGRASSKLLDALHHWLQVTHVESLAKDPALFPTFTPEIAADLRTSLNLFLQDAVLKGDSDYRELLLADSVFLNPRLAKFYGVAVPSGSEFVKVPLDPPHRAGVLTHPYLLAAFAYPRSTSPIHRGVFLTRNIVGRALNPPPMAVAFKDAEFDPAMTMREKVAELTRPQACQACHSFINPLGFSLEYFDAVGRYRTEDNHRPVDVVGDYTTEDGTLIHLAGARDVARFAADSADARKGFIEQLFHQLVKQPMRAYGPDVNDRLHRSFVASGFDVQDLVVEIVTCTALHDSTRLTAARTDP